MKKNLVLGVAKGYSWDILEPFVNSCKKNCPSTELVLFVDDISDFTRDKLLREGVLLLNFPAGMTGGIPNNTRWKIFSDFLQEYGDGCEQIFITDTRDVIFQSDVFTPFKNFSNYIGFTTEVDDIGGSKFGDRVNYNWIADCFGREEADKLVNRKIICCGTVIATANEMKIFCRELWKILQYKTTDIFDQAVTNYLVWNNLMPIENLVEIDVEGGEIFTYSIIKDNKIRGDKILRGDGEIPAVVHQYDRHENLVQLVDKIYRDKNFQADGRFTDTRSTLEQATSLLFADKIGKATRLFMKKYLSISDFHYYGGALIRLWRIALSKPLSQSLELLEIAAQDAAKSTEYFQGHFLSDICASLKHAKNIGHPVNPEFQSHIAKIIFKSAQQALKANWPDRCLYCIELFEELEMPPDKDFYLFVAKANRIFGRKTEALEAYKKVLDLS